MEKSKLQGNILLELNTLISLSCRSTISLKQYEQLHIALLKKHYNAAHVHIDYHRHRIQLDIVTDDSFYKPNKVNTHLPILHTNLLFNNLKSFLASCVDIDEKSVGFYAQLLTHYTGKKITPSLA